jgi:hypothetical protein
MTPILSLLLLLLLGDASVAEATSTPDSPKITLPQTSGKTIKSRFAAPADFDRLQPMPGTFGYYLQNLPLYTADWPVRLYNGQLKGNQSVHTAVIDMDVGNRDLQQCADAVMRLRAEYLWETNQRDKIAFHFTNGFYAPYSKWRDGQRIRVSGNKVSWVGNRTPDTSYRTFRKYLNMIFAYAGTISLNKELEKTSLQNLQIGDVFIQAGSPGHAVIVVDMAVHTITKERCFMLAQSYMPAQDIHVLVNPADPDRGPWYFEHQLRAQLFTPEWTFPVTAVKRFKDE